MEHYLLKISSAGNRFLLFDETGFGNKLPKKWKIHSYKTKYSPEDFLKLPEDSLKKRKNFIKNLTAEKNLSLTDGLIVLRPIKNSFLSCDFYNKDGTTAEMCGNAACCVSVYIKWIKLPLKKFSLGQENVTIVENKLGKRGIALNSTPSLIGKFDFEFQKKQMSFNLINPGVPHAVIELPKKEKILFKNKSQLKALAQYLRFKNPKSSKGMNVSFFQVEKTKQLKAVTFERGVEDFTLACGTGALSTALVYLHNKQTDNQKVTVCMPGGKLKIQIKNQVQLFSPVKMGY